MLLETAGRNFQYTGLPLSVVNLDLLAGGECRLNIISRPENIYQSQPKDELPPTISIVVAEPLKVLGKCRWSINRDEINIRGENAIAMDIAGEWEIQMRKPVEFPNARLIYTRVEPVERHARLKIKGDTLKGKFDEIELPEGKDHSSRHLPEMDLDLRLVK